MTTDEARRARWKRAWEMHFIEGLKWREAGKLLGVSAERARQLAASHRRYMKIHWDWKEKVDGRAK